MEDREEHITSRFASACGLMDSLVAANKESGALYERLEKYILSVLEASSPTEGDRS